MSGIAGVDVSKASLDVFVIGDKRPWRVSNTRKGIDEMCRRLAQRGVDRVVLEPSGGYEKAPIVALRAAAIPVALANAAQVRHFAKAAGIHGKTDAIDARLIAVFGERMNPRLLEKPDPARERLAALVERRRQIVEMRTAEKNRLGTADARTRPSIQDHIDYLSRQEKAVQNEAKQIVRADAALAEQDRRLRSAPGVGDKTSHMLLAQLPELGRIDKKPLAALVGVAPFPCESGKHAGQRRIRGGRANVRVGLYMATITAIRLTGPIRETYLQMVKRGMLKKKALVACVHKLLRRLNAMIRDGVDWTTAPGPSHAVAGAG